MTARTQSCSQTRSNRDRNNEENQQTEMREISLLEMDRENRQSGMKERRQINKLYSSSRRKSNREEGENNYRTNSRGKHKPRTESGREKQRDGDGKRDVEKRILIS